MEIIREITKKEAAVKELCERLSSEIYSNAVFDYEVFPNIIIITGHFKDFRIKDFGIGVCYTIFNDDSPVPVSEIVEGIDNSILKMFKK